MLKKMDEHSINKAFSRERVKIIKNLLNGNN